MKTDPIQDYILKSEQNLRIAAAVGEAWPDAREKLVSAFLDRLDTRLKRKLKGWKSDRWGALLRGRISRLLLLEADMGTIRLGFGVR